MIMILQLLIFLIPGATVEIKGSHTLDVIKKGSPLNVNENVFKGELC